MASINISCPASAPSSSKAFKNFKLFSGLQCVKLFSANGYTTDSSLVHLGGKSFFSIKSDGRTKAALLSREGGDLRSHPKGANTVARSTLIVDLSAGTETQPESIAFGTLGAETTPATFGFPVDNDEFDLDYPTKAFSSIPEAIEDIRQGKMVVVVDDEDRENEGDLIMAASMVTPEAMAFFVKHGTGIVCVSMKGEDLERLELPLMVARKDNEEKLCTAFTVSVDAKEGTTTGVSAHDRATTILALASKDSKPEDFNRPGHIFPLKYREGGVLKRAGHTEASVDLAMLAGLDPVAVLCEIVDDDGSMARLPMLQQFVQSHNLKIISIADLIRYGRKRDKLVERSSAVRIPTMWGPFTAYCYRSFLDGIEHIAMVKVILLTENENTKDDLMLCSPRAVSVCKIWIGRLLGLWASLLPTLGKGDIGDGQDILVTVDRPDVTVGTSWHLQCNRLRLLARVCWYIFVAMKGGALVWATSFVLIICRMMDVTLELSLPVDSREYGIGAQV